MASKRYRCVKNYNLINEEYDTDTISLPDAYHRFSYKYNELPQHIYDLADVIYFDNVECFHLVKDDRFDYLQLVLAEYEVRRKAYLDDNNYCKPLVYKSNG